MKFHGSDKDVTKIQSKMAESGQDINTFDAGKDDTYKTSSEHGDCNIDECANDQFVKSKKSIHKKMHVRHQNVNEMKAQLHDDGNKKHIIEILDRCNMF